MKEILVVDDCEDLREIISDMLSGAGYAVQLAASAKEAEEFFSNKKYDLIICDLVLPLESDDEDAEEESDSAMVGIHAISNFAKECPETPIIAISGHLTGAPLQAIKKFGAVQTLSKPFSRNELLAKVGEALTNTPRATVN